MYKSSKEKIIHLISGQLALNEIRIIQHYLKTKDNVTTDLFRSRALGVLKHYLEDGFIVLMFDDWDLRIFDNEAEVKTFLLNKAKDHVISYNSKEYDSFYENILRNVVPPEADLSEFDILAYCMGYDMYCIV